MRAIRILALVIAVLGWVGLGYFTYYNPPDPANRLVVLGILFPTLTATLFVPAHLLNSRPLLAEGVASRSLRQSALSALYLALCLWLRMTQALSWINAVLLFVIVGLAELVLSAREG